MYPPTENPPRKKKKKSLPLSVSKLIKIIELCTNQYFFKYNNIITNKNLASSWDLLAYLYQQFLESQSFKHLLPNDIQYIRYIHDILIIYPKEHNIPQIAFIHDKNKRRIIKAYSIAHHLS